MRPVVLLLATLDTKGLEIAYMKGIIEKMGVNTLIMDTGLINEPAIKPDIDRYKVALAGGMSVNEILSLSRRDLMMDVIADGALRIATKLLSEGKIHGLISVGGNQGTAIATKVMRSLPLGTPKVMVSTVANGNTRPYIGFTDTMMLFPLADVVGGPNSVTGTVLANAAGAIAGMCLCTKPIEQKSNVPVIALTAFGNIEQCVNVEIARIREAGYEPITFHSSGAGGSAMEQLAKQGLISGVIDNISHELLGELYPVDYYRPVVPGRLTYILEQRLPLVFVPGGLDYYVMGSFKDLPGYLKKRRIHYHNPENTNVRTNASELRAVARLLAKRFESADKRKVRVLIPQKGWTEFSKAGKPLHDTELDSIFVSCLRKNCKNDISILEVDKHINDPSFAELCVNSLMEMMAYR